VLGIYGRAYQLISMPTENLNSIVGGVIFPALSRVQNDPARLRRYFLKGYSLFLALVTPITVACALFADDIVLVLLGPQWHGAAAIFRLLTPTILAFALINPFGSLMQASGHAVRSLKISFLIAPVVVLGYLFGLAHGPRGVALGFSAAMVVLVAPVLMWAKHGTLITARDIARSAMHPFLSVAIAAVTLLFVRSLTEDLRPAILRLTGNSVVLFGVYSMVLLFGFKQKHVYLDLLQASGLWPMSQPTTE
jgi:PST family polysaccharide transporter